MKTLEMLPWQVTDISLSFSTKITKTTTEIKIKKAKQIYKKQHY